MPNENRLTAAEKGLEAALAALRPAQLTGQRDQIMFRAGQTSARQHNRLWQSATVLLIVLAGWLWLTRPAPLPTERIVHVQVSPPEAPKSTAALATLEYRFDDRWQELQLN